eukprot:Hpha_TRINITY_DN15540_c1_g1::TRINITY_DN15540_c1_g1_i1::g.104287::m.104287
MCYSMMHDGPLIEIKEVQMGSYDIKSPSGASDCSAQIPMIAAQNTPSRSSSIRSAMRRGSSTAEFPVRSGSSASNDERKLKRVSFSELSAGESFRLRFAQSLKELREQRINAGIVVQEEDDDKAEELQVDASDDATPSLIPTLQFLRRGGR